MKIRTLKPTPVKTKFYILWLIHFSVLTFFSLITQAQISGSVFRDINNDGARQTSNPTEPWEYGVVVKAYNSANTLIGTATTDANGEYSFSAAQAPSGLAVRIEFTVHAGDQPSKRMAAGRSNIQFVVAGPTAVNINFAVASKKSFSDNSNPYVATTGYTNGNAVSSGTGTAGDNDNLYVFPYDLSSDGGTTRRAKNQHLGAVFGLSWQRESRTLFMAAYLKRHAGFGPNGIGAIYASQISASGFPTTPTLFVDVTTIGINVGSNPRSTTLPSNSSTPNTDNGVFAEVGKRGIGGIDLSVDGREMYLVNMYEKKLHRINIGNPLKSALTASDVTGTWVIPDPMLPGTSWHPMAVEVNNGKVYVGGVTTRETTSAHAISDTINLRGIVYEFDPATSGFTEVLRFPLTHRRGYTNADYRYENRNNFWSGWQNNGDVSIGGPLRSGLIGSSSGSNATGIYYPQPMLCNIEFDVDGSMILGIRDRFGDQGGYANYFETGNTPGETYRALASGEVLRAGKDGAGWSLENKGAVTTNGVTTSSLGLADNTPLGLGSFVLQLLTPWGGSLGPGGGYYYYNQNFTKTGVPAAFSSGSTNTSHYVKSNGGLAVYPGYNEVLTTAIDPASKGYTNGLIRNYNLGTNAGNMSGRMDLVGTNTSGVGDPTNMGKAAALGDLEILLDAEAMEIGNIVWYDANHNGRQDAHERGIGNVTVTLRSPGADGVYGNGDDETWTVVTDAKGHYYFDASIVNDARRPASWLGVSATNSGILPGFEYRIDIDAAQPALGGYYLSMTNMTNDAIDNDGVTGAGGMVQYIVNAGGSTAATSVFDNNYNVDFGFYRIVLGVHQLDLTATLTGNDVSVKWTTKEESNVSKHYVERSNDGNKFSTIGFAYSKGNGDFAYQATDNLSEYTSPVVFYRIRTEDINGTITYSNVVRLNLNKITKMLVGPNPFISSINVQVSVSVKTEAAIRIVNMTGQVIYRKGMKLEKGVNSFVLNEFQQLCKGLYVVEIEAGEITERQKLIKQ